MTFQLPSFRESSSVLSALTTTNNNTTNDIELKDVSLSKNPDLEKVIFAHEESTTLGESKEATNAFETSTEFIFTPNTKKLLFYCLILCLTAFPLGWDVGTTGNLTNHPSFTYLNLAPLELGLIISSFLFGALVGCLTLAILPLNLKMILRIASGFYLGGTVLEIVCLNFVPGTTIGFGIGRLFSGVACGAMCVVGPLYMSELLVDGFSKRGMFMSFFQSLVCLMIVAGNSLVHVVPGIGYIHTVEFFKIGFVVIINAVLFFVPNSIKHNIITGNLPELRTVYSKLYSNWTSAQEADIQRLIELQTHRYSSSSSNILQVFAKRESINKVLKCSALMALQQLTGINYFFYFGSITFNSPYAVLIMSLINFAGSLTSAQILQTFKMRWILVVNSLLMAIFMFGYAISGTASMQLSIVLSCGFIFCFSVSWGPCVGILANIISDNNAGIVSVAVACNWLTNWIITMVTPSMINAVGYGYGYFFGGFLVAMILFCYQFVDH